MAVVRISQSLKDDVKRNARSMFDVRIREAGTLPFAGAELNERIYGGLFTEQELQHIDGIKHLTSETISRFTVAEINGQQVGYTVDFPTSKPWVSLSYDYVTSGTGAKLSRYNVKLFGEQWNDLAEQAKVRNEKVSKLTNDRDEFVASIDKLLDRHTTLAPALREWKPLWELLPEDAKERHKKKVERKRSPEQTKAELEADGIDLNKMTSVVGLNRLRGGA